LAVYRCGGLAVFCGGVTWQNLKAVGSFASHWSGFGRRNSSRGSGAMDALLRNHPGPSNRGKTLREICSVMNDSGIKTSKGSVFHPVQITRILRRSPNPAELAA